MLDTFLKIIEGNVGAEVVWAADLNYWITGERVRGAADPSWDTECGYLELHRKLGVMPYYYYGKFWLGEPVYETPVTVSVDLRGNETITHMRTPVGEISQVLCYMPTSCSTGTIKHFVQSEDDLDVFIYILEHRHLIPACLDDYQERLALWRGYDGLPSIALPRSPLSAFVYDWAGVMQAVYLLADCPDKVRAALRLMGEQEEPILDAVCRESPSLVHFADNLSSDTLTGLYDEYLAPVHAYRLDRLHAVGTRCAVHMDGIVRGLLPKLAEVGFDAVEALTPKPAGDLDVADMPEVAGSEKLVLWGGVPGIMFSAPYTWPDMEAHVRHVLAAWGDRPFILGVADQVPPDGDISFCQRIAELVSGWRT